MELNIGQVDACAINIILNLFSNNVFLSLCLGLWFETLYIIQTQRAGYTSAKTHILIHSVPCILGFV